MIVNQYALAAQQQAFQAQVARAMTLSTSATPFGCSNFFDRCTDELMSLHFAGGLPLLDWMGFEVSDECHKSFEYITFVRPAYVDNAATAGHIAAPCTDPKGWEYGTAGFTIDGFSRYGRLGPTRDIMKPKFYCMTDPRRRLDGTPVTDEREWDVRFTTEALIQDISRDIIVGNNNTAGKMDGLEQIVKTGYDSPILDSQVINFGGKTLSGGIGITWNGTAIAGSPDFVEVLRAVIRYVRTRISWSPMLRNQSMNLGDMILVMPSHVATELLDFFTCWSVCPGATNQPVQLQTYEARKFRDSLGGGLYGHGQITIEGIPIPILAYDYELIKGPTLNDIYLLMGSVGSVRLWFGEHISAATAAAGRAGNGYFSTDGGRMLGQYTNENECEQLRMWMHPRIYTRAPWAQVRFQNVKVSSFDRIISPDPIQSSFYPVTSFVPELAVTS